MKTPAIKPAKPAANTEQLSSLSKRQQILEDANEQFLETYKEIKTCLDSEEAKIFENRYNIGLKVEDMAKLESEYGSKPVDRMAELLGSGKDVIYQSLLFVQRFDYAEMTELTKIRNRDGDPILWTHLTHLIRVVDRDVRQSLLKKCVDNSWSPAELLQAIQTQKGGKSNPSAGKPLARPKNIKGFIDQQVTYLDQLLKRKEKVWAGQEKPGDSSFLDLINSTPTSEFNPKLLDEIESLNSKYESASLALEAMSTELTKVVRRIEENLEEKKEKEAARPKSIKDFLKSDSADEDEESELNKAAEEEAERIEFETMKEAEEAEDEEEPTPKKKGFSIPSSNNIKRKF